MIRLRFLRGYSSLDIRTTRKLTRITKETIMCYSHPDVVESLIVQRSDPFFKIVEIRYYTAAAGERLRLGGSDTGKEVFNLVFINDAERRLHWLFIRGLKPEEYNNTIFYDTSDSNE